MIGPSTDSASRTAARTASAIGDVGLGVMESHPRRRHPFEVGGEARVGVGPGPPEERQPDPRLAREGQRAFRGDPLAAPAHEQDVGWAEDRRGGPARARAAARRIGSRRRPDSS